MKKFISLEDYGNSFNKYVEEVTRLQRLVSIEEQKLFELMQIKKQTVAAERQIADD